MREDARRRGGVGLEGLKARRLGGRKATRARAGRQTAGWNALLLLLILIGGCSSRPATSPVDSTGTHRIISLVPAATEMLFAIGAGPDVVGVSSFDRFPAEVADLPKVGALVDPDFERIVTLQPTLVVVYGSQDDLMARLDRASVATFRYQHAVEDSLADIPRTLRALGQRVGRGAEAEDVAVGIERDLDDVRARVADRPKPSTALVFGREPGALRGLYVSGGAGFLHDVLDAAGGRNVFNDVKRESLQASAETMLARQPEVIIELRTSATTAERLGAERDVWRRLSALPAVRNDRVYILTDPALSIPGPRIALAARAFLAVLHPDAR